MSKLLLCATVTIVLTPLVGERLDARVSAADQVAAKSVKTLDNDCKRGDASACFDLAFRYQQGEGVGRTNAARSSYTRRRAPVASSQAA